MTITIEYPLNKCETRYNWRSISKTTYHDSNNIKRQTEVIETRSVRNNIVPANNAFISKFNSPTRNTYINKTHKMANTNNYETLYINNNRNLLPKVNYYNQLYCHKINPPKKQILHVNSKKIDLF